MRFPKRDVVAEQDRDSLSGTGAMGRVEVDPWMLKRGVGRHQRRRVALRRSSSVPYYPSDDAQQYDQSEADPNDPTLHRLARRIVLARRPGTRDRLALGSA